jgi:hypothetical protein
MSHIMSHVAQAGEQCLELYLRAGTADGAGCDHPPVPAKAGTQQIIS